VFENEQLPSPHKQIVDNANQHQNQKQVD
jgi:hypothetical protein